MGNQPRDLAAEKLSLRDQLRVRAQGHCEYCRIHEQFTTLRFQMDHVVSQKHRGPTELANLAWCCADCNAYKGSDLSGIDPQTGELHRLFNPRLDTWISHFYWNGPLLASRTPVGRTTITVLQINREERVALRRELMRLGLFD